MHVVIVCVRQHGCELVLVVLVFVNIVTRHRQDRPIVALHLPICLGVVCRRKDIRDSKQLAYCLEELGSQLIFVAGDDALLGSIRTDPVLNECNCDVVSGDIPQRYDPCEFRKAVLYHEKEYVASLRLCQRSQYVDT